MKRYSDLDKRMKNYEAIPKTKLMRRTPVVIRIDGRAFHTFTQNLRKPFDTILMEAMQDTTKYLCENIPGCVLGYTQSDEISLVLVDYDTLDKSAWFGYEVQKMCSIVASMTTMRFNKIFTRKVDEAYTTLIFSEDEDYLRALIDAIDMGACFDARVFNIPKEEVTNYIYWRQADASKNSIQMVGHANFTEEEMHKKSVNDIQDMLMLEKSINWNDFTVSQKRGTCVIKKPVDKNNKKEKWVIDYDIPIFKGFARNYVNELVFYEE